MILWCLVPSDARLWSLHQAVKFLACGVRLQTQMTMDLSPNGNSLLYGNYHLAWQSRCLPGRGYLVMNSEKSLEKIFRTRL